MKPHENIMKCFFSLLIRLMEIRYKLYQIKKKRASERENHHHYESDAFIYEVCSLWKIIKKIIQTLIKAATWQMQQIFFLFIIKTLIAACKKWWSPLGMDTLKWHNAVYFNLLCITRKVTFITPYLSIVQFFFFLFFIHEEKIYPFFNILFSFRQNVCSCYGNVINQAST